MPTGGSASAIVKRANDRRIIKLSPDRLQATHVHSHLFRVSHACGEFPDCLRPRTQRSRPLRNRSQRSRTGPLPSPVRPKRRRPERISLPDLHACFLSLNHSVKQLQYTDERDRQAAAIRTSLTDLLSANRR